MNVEIDEQLLQSIAEHTGGVFYKATDGDRFREIFSEIDELEEKSQETLTFRAYFRRNSLFGYLPFPVPFFE